MYAYMQEQRWEVKLETVLIRGEGLLQEPSAIGESNHMPQEMACNNYRLSGGEAEVILDLEGFMACSC